MFSLIRRISYSVIPRPDRPWEDDPTSNAPNTRRKRRLSSTEREATDVMDEEHSRKKKLRGDSESVENLGSDDIVASPAEDASDITAAADEDVTVEVHREGSVEVKVVTRGVKGVELEDKDATSTSSDDKDQEQNTQEIAATGTDAEDEPATDTATATAEVTADAVVNPESIPLPDEQTDELDELRSSSPAPQETSIPTASTPSVESIEAPNRAVDAGTPSRPGNPRASARSSSPRKLRSSSPKKVLARA
ncbi:hypothetical protein P691DRAFT_758559 [Macrolepiota fuliginosa MF-IS2]|uniref:Uncharacterized protein n=1 Tax=Macrolepiota fuliginosa MF-IS2 TaxID=1400762 RepID=A0A9P5XGY1_9AGAR|nr:hypothetical protein P691DRAFT_758559 [Macrolepiota fuliginosa MF-IS2]